MLRPVLVPLDGSDLAEQALPYAEALAKPGCELILLEVGQESDDEFSLLERHADSCARLETAAGDPAEQILQVADDLGAGLIVMTTHGRGALGRWAFGSVADQVTRTSRVPVLVVRPRTDRDAPEPVIQRLVLPLDGSALAEQAVPVAQSLAQRLNVPVHLLTAIDVASLLPVDVVPPVAVNVALYEETVAQLDSGAAATLAEVSDRLQQAGVQTSAEVLHGSPFLTIAEAARPGDVIVMTSHGRGGVKRWLLGSVAEKLIREGPVPVILVPAKEGRDEVPLANGAMRTASPASV
jgi:nucleotide-binding universal stress UspA family protein